MTKPADAIKAVIDETLAPRIAAHHARLAGAQPDPLAVARTDLHYVWDDYGTQYLDFASGMHPIGHRHAAVLNALSDHSRHYHFSAPLGHHLARWPVQYAKDLGEAFQKLSWVDTKVLFCEGQREAVWKACELATAGTGKQVAVLHTGWHGWIGNTVEVESVTLNSEVHGALLLATLDTHAMPVPVEPWVAAARSLGIPVIVDESVTGFGRTGPMWSAPPDAADITVLGGPVGGSLPLGAVVGPAHYFDGPIDVSSQAGNPLACAAGAAVWAILSMGILEHTAETAPVLTSALIELADQFPEHIAGFHGKGHLRGIRLRRPDPQFHLRARQAGLLVAPPVDGQTVVISPPLVASPLELKRGVDMLADAVLSWDDEYASPPTR